MKPIEFPEQNCVYAKDQPEYQPLPAYRAPDGDVTACWSMSWREPLRVAMSGRVYVTIATFGQPLAPSLVRVEPPLVAK